MGNFKIEIEAVGGHGCARDTKQGDAIPYDKVHANEPDRLAYEFVKAFKAAGNNVIFAKLTHWPESTPIIDDLITGKREYGDFQERWQGEEMLKHFAFWSLPEGVARETGRSFCHLAFNIVRTLPRNPERTVALRKLLEGRDAALRTLTQQ